MPFWPFLMGSAAVLAIWGLRHDAWKVPALAFAGYAAVRWAVVTFPAALHEVTFCLIWLCVASAMTLCRAYVPAFFYALAGLAYPVGLLLGSPAGYLHLSSIISALCDVLALLAIGGGIAGISLDRVARRRGRSGFRGVFTAPAVATGQENDSRGI